MLVLSSLFFWHQYEVKTAVVKATNAIELQYAREKFKLIDKAQAETFALRDQVDAITKDKMLKFKLLMLGLLLSLAACQSAPNVPPAMVVFPEVPAMQKAPDSWMQADYIGLMQKWLSGSLPELKD